MAGWSGSGTFTRTHDWTQDQGNGIKIRADRHDDNDVDFVSGINNCMTKDGQNSATANLNMGANKLTNGATATLVGDFTIVSDIQNSVQTFITSTGSANAYVLTLAPAPAAYVAGQTFVFKANFANTGAATVDVNGLGAKTIKKLADTTDLEADDILVDQIVIITYDGTVFQSTIVSRAAAGWKTQRNVTISADVTVEFEQGVSGVDFTIFDEYRIVVRNVIPTTNDQTILLSMSDDGGATSLSMSFIVTSYASNGSTFSATNSTGTTTATLFQGAGTATGEGVDSVIEFGNLNSALHKNVYGRGVQLNSDGNTMTQTFTGTAPTTSAIDSITFSTSSTSLASGSLILQGRDF